MTQELEVNRGDIFYCDFGQDNIYGSEQRGMRPVIVIQNNKGNLFSPTIIVAPITTKRKRNLPTHVSLKNYDNLARKCVALLEQPRTVDKSRLHEYLVSLNSTDMDRIDQAILISLGIAH